MNDGSKSSLISQTPSNVDGFICMANLIDNALWDNSDTATGLNPNIRLESLIDMLIPDDLNERTTCGCIVARDLLTTIFVNTSCTSSPVPLAVIEHFKSRFFTDLFSRLRQRLAVYRKESCSTGAQIPSVLPIIHALTVICERLQSSSNMITDSLLSDIMILSATLGTAVQDVIRNFNSFTNNAGSIHAPVVFTFEVFRLWRCAIRAQSKLPQSNSLLYDTRLPLVVLNTVETVLISDTSWFSMHPDDYAGNHTGMPNTSSVAVIFQLMLRGLQTLSKHLQSIDPNSQTLSSRLDRLIQKIVCFSPATVTPDGVCLQPCVNFLLRQCSSQDLTQIRSDAEHFIHDSDQTPALSLLLLLALDLANRCDPSDSMVHTLLQSIRSMVTRSAPTPVSASFSQTYEALTVDLLTGNDTHLIRGLNLWLIIANKLLHYWSAEHWFLIPNPHWLFCHLLKAIDYSPHLFVDWIVSPETEILSYLVHYLRLYRQSSPVHRLLDVRHLKNPLVVTAIDHHAVRWPTHAVLQFFSQLLRCLDTLSAHGNIPFNPGPLTRSLQVAIDVLEGPDDAPSATQ